ncbi:basic membrane protein A [Streptomyces aidingensis]|uniref:Basic membrane protein A n=1 Tax=Streptomyces aidingensis TaxID=910347 RepID=A0A1I1EH26_9ACTN|nr:basic membrane protein A [Streptomyces aidingensis]
MAATVALALSAAACGESSTESEGAEKGPAVAFDVGGRDDQSFNESAARGGDKAEEELGVEVFYQTAREGETDADREQRLTQMAEAGYDPVIGVGFLYGTAVERAAEQFPDTTFGIVDSVVEADNVYSMVFAEHEASYLAGVAAALKTQTNVVGFIGGENNPLIQKFQAGFEQGVADTSPDVEVLVEYLYENSGTGAGFADPAKAKEKADGMIVRDADIIYTAAGASGNGSIEEVAKHEGVWAIGVDSDQYQQEGLAEWQDHILTSAVKAVDVAVFDLIQSVESGEPLSGVGEYGLAEEGVYLATSGGFIDDIQAEIDAAREGIINGDIEVSQTP